MDPKPASGPAAPRAARHAPGGHAPHLGPEEPCPAGPGATPHPASDAHHHHHHHHHDTQDAPPDSAAFALATLLNLGFVALETGYGWATGSLALLSDALHNLGDVLGLALAWVAARLALRAPDARHTYGWRRATLLAPLLNALLLVTAAGALLWEALRRLGQTPAVEAWPVIVVAAIGIGVNLGSALLFRRGHAHDLNRRGAYLHLLSDAAVSLAVVLGGLGMLWMGWRWLDPVLAIGVAGVILWSTWGLLRESLALSLDAVPRQIDADAVRTALAQLPGVLEVHHLHVWSLGAGGIALTAHVVRPGGAPDARFLEEAQRLLRVRFGIGHATLQVEDRTADRCGADCG